MDSLILQAAIALVFIFATGAAMVSVITESISRYIGLRSEYLLRGLRTLLDGNGTFKLPVIEAVTGRVTKKRERDAAAPAASAATEALLQAATHAAAATAAAKTAADARNKQAQAPAAVSAERADNAPAAVVRTEADAAAKQADEPANAADAAADALKAAQTAAQLSTGSAEKRPPALVAQIMAHPLVGVTSKAGQRPANAGDAPLTNRQRRQLPSYVSGRSFARALIDVIVPNANGVTTMSQIRDAIEKTPAGEIPSVLRSALLSMAKDADNAADDIARFRTTVEHWYDDQMARVSGWYKRHIRWVSLGIGLGIVLVFNLNVLTIARSIYTDEAVRGSVVTKATEASSCGKKTPAECLQDLRGNIGSVRGAGLPIGWTKVQRCVDPKSDCNWFEDRGLWVHNGRGWLSQLVGLGLILLGWGIMVIALLPGANFWFDILGRLGTLRASGPKPKTA